MTNLMTADAEELEKLIYEISKMDNKQLAALKKHIEFEVFPDTEDADVFSIKEQVYSKYAKVISNLIAKVEVYLHDLPRQICGLIEMTFRVLATSSAEVEKVNEIRLCSATLNYIIFLENTLYALLIENYIEEIKRYSNLFVRFNHNGILAEDEKPFVQVVKSQLKDVAGSFKIAKRKYKKIYSLNFWKYAVIIGKVSRIENMIPWLKHLIPYEFSINVTTGEEVNGLKQCCEEAEKIISDCELNYSKIINNGYSPPLWRKIIWHIPNVISTALALWGAILIVKK